MPNHLAARAFDVGLLSRALAVSRHRHWISARTGCGCKRAKSLCRRVGRGSPRVGAWALHALSSLATALSTVNDHELLHTEQSSPRTGLMAGTSAKSTAAMEAYFTDLGQVRASGGATGERSAYGPLASLLNAVVAALKPKVFCVGEPADQGAGHLNFGQYAAKQVQRGRPREGQIPERGVVEVKAADEGAWITAAADKMSRNWGRYRWHGKMRPRTANSYALTVVSLQWRSFVYETEVRCR